MKKAALTIGLFSLVVITTSFTTPEQNTSLTFAINSNSIYGGQKIGQDKKLDVILPIDGGQKTGLDRKQDFTNTSRFGSDSQSIVTNRKID